MPKKPQRQPLKGMDAFLQAPPAEPTTEGQQDSTPSSQDTSMPALIKGTYYITPEHDLKLERIRLARKRKGKKIDKSALIREAIDLLQE
jgi:hypothetical protein